MVIFLLAYNPSLAKEQPPFKGVVNADNINVRSDSTVSSEVICPVSKGDTLEVISECYDWYKIRLPKNACAYIKKNMAECINTETGKQCLAALALKDRVNIRLRPSESSPILGRVNKNEIINIRGIKGEWYKIEPAQNSFGWIHKKFVNKTPGPTDDKEGRTTHYLEDNIVVEGKILPYGMVFKRQATHKLITPDSRIFLLKGDKAGLNALNYQKVKVTGKKTGPPNQKHPIIEVKIIEVID